MDYWQKFTKNPHENLLWNLPEQKQGSVCLFGGNDKSFNNEIRFAEKILGTSPLKELKIVLPETLKNKLPPMDNFLFLKATDSGSLDASAELTAAANMSDFNLFLGDFSKNSITNRAVSGACVSAEKPLLITRDAVDLIAESNPEKILEKESVIILASMAQLQKLLHAALYPKMILLSMPLMQIVEILHKFTLSYPLTVVTFHGGNIIVAKDGIVNSVSLEQTSYSPLTLWTGDLAAKIVLLNLYNPNNYLAATTAALF
jgi:hypothetical protein